MVKLIGPKESSHTLFFKFGNCEDNFIWVFIGVYRPTNKNLREEPWKDIGVVRGVWLDPWCLGRDFNVLRFPRERNREGRWVEAMRRFFQVLDNLILKDLPLQGGVFTWS